MEVCGGQTHAIVRFGLDEMLPAEVTLIHGPGCPVCVTPLEMIDKAIAIASRPDVIFCSFGDMLRVPGSDRDLLSVKAAGGDVRIVYSPLDAVKLAPTEPRPAGGVLRRRLRDHRPGQRDGGLPGQAGRRGELLASSCRTCSCRRPSRRSSASPANRVQGFLAAGHVCAVMGYTEYEPIAARYRVPIVVTGFEPLDILQGVYLCVKQLEEGRAEVENQYARVGRDARAIARRRR